jgi:glucose/mannose-6-phosphate isomerase
MVLPVDSLGMWEITRNLPDQLEAAVSDARGVTDLPDAEDIDHVVVMGMGGSGIAGDVVRAVAGPMMPVPVVTSKGYPCPGFVNRRSLVIAVSFSGNTEETVEAASGAEAAGARMVVVTSGGRLGALATQWGAPVYGVDTSIPMPRAAVGAVSVPALMALERVGLFPGAERWLEFAVHQLRHRRDTLAGADDPTTRVAETIGDAVPLVYGGGDLGGVAAVRWKNQVNENAKAPAFANEMPELCHNEIAGWGQVPDGFGSHLALVTLRHGHEHPQIGRRFEYNETVVGPRVAATVEVRAEGEGPLAQLFDLMYVGDHVSLHLAAARGIDPGPIDVLDRLKVHLSTD